MGKGLKVLSIGKIVDFMPIFESMYWFSNFI